MLFLVIRKLLKFNEKMNSCFKEYENERRAGFCLFTPFFEVGSEMCEKNEKRSVYNTDAILSTEFPVFHEDFSGRSG